MNPPPSSLVTPEGGSGAAINFWQYLLNSVIVATFITVVALLIHLYAPDTAQVRTIKVGEMVGSIAPIQGGGLVAAVATGFVRVDLASGAVRPLTGAEVRRLGASTYQPETAASARRGTP